MLLAGEQPRGNLHDVRRHGAGSLVRAAQNVGALLRVHRQERRSDRMDIPVRALGKLDIADGDRRIGHSRGGAVGSAQETVLADVAGININGAQSVIDAHARAVGTGKRGVFNVSIAQRHGKVARILDKDLGERAAARQGAGDNALANSR